MWFIISWFAVSFITAILFGALVQWGRKSNSSPHVRGGSSTGREIVETSK